MPLRSDKKAEGRASSVERKKSSRLSSLVSRLKAVRLFLCDVDGVLTDGAVYLGDLKVTDIGYKIGPKDFGPDGRALLRLGKKRGILTLKSE